MQLFATRESRGDHQHDHDAEDAPNAFEGIGMLRNSRHEPEGRQDERDLSDRASSHARIQALSDFKRCQTLRDALEPDLGLPAALSGLTRGIMTDVKAVAHNASIYSNFRPQLYGMAHGCPVVPMTEFMTETNSSCLIILRSFEVSVAVDRSFALASPWRAPL